MAFDPSMLGSLGNQPQVRSLLQMLGWRDPNAGGGGGGGVPQSVASTMAASDAMSGGGGGGGGGAAGVIVIHGTKSGTGVVSPPAS